MKSLRGGSLQNFNLNDGGGDVWLFIIQHLRDLHAMR